MKKIIIAYIPAIHEGYIKFLKSHSDADLYLIGDEIIKEIAIEIPYYGRDIRAINSDLVKEMLQSLYCVSNVYLLNSFVLERFKETEYHIIMPKEDISTELSRRYFGSKHVDFEPVFLRWDKVISQVELQISPDRIISNNEFDLEIITQAKAEGGKSSDWWRQVGAAVVRDGKIVLRSFNSHMPNEHNPNVLGDPRSNLNAGERIDVCTALHAEAGIIAKAAKEGISLNDTSIYVTTFPCPGCARLIAKAGIKKVYYAQGYSLLDAEEIFKVFKIEVVLVKS